MFSQSQTLLKSIYDHFAVLYQNISPPSPNLAGEHALKQEQEDYDRSTKTTYRHVRILRLGLSIFPTDDVSRRLSHL